MGTTPNQPHNPVVEKRNAAAENLNRKRKTAAEMSVKVAEETVGFFDKLAVLNAGALTFSVTLLSHPTQKHWQLLVVFAAWGFLLLALASCLIRNYANMAHRFYKAGADQAEAEVALIEADSDAVTALGSFIKYADATEPFDVARELQIDKENREVWQKEFDRRKTTAEVRWVVNLVAQWAAGISMCLGFLLLIVFAVFNSYR
jgi:hypothetical protein